MLIGAPGKTAPVWSVTVPRIRPKLACASSAKEKSDTTRLALNTHVVILRLNVTDLIMPPFHRHPFGRVGKLAALETQRRSMSREMGDSSAAAVSGILIHEIETLEDKPNALVSDVGN